MINIKYYYVNLINKKKKGSKEKLVECITCLSANVKTRHPYQEVERGRESFLFPDVSPPPLFCS